MAGNNRNSKKNTALKDIELMRQERVASLRARKMSMREIQAQLADPNSKAYMENPDTGKPYDLATIQRDLARIRKRADHNAQRDVSKWLADQLDEIHEAKRSAWASRDLQVLARFIELEAKLTGTLQNKLMHKLDDDQFEKLGDFRESLMSKLEMMIPPDDAT